MRPSGLIAALALCLAAVLAPALPASAAPAAAPFASPADPVDVVGDDGHDLYVGTGGLVVSSKDWRGDEDGRRQAASCEGCEWRVTSYCTRLEFDAGGCAGSYDGCPAGSVRVRVWQREEGGPWRYLGPACWGGDRPLTRTEIGAAVRDRAEQALPALRAGVQPAGAVLVGLPAVFRTGQPRGGIEGADLDVLDLDVVLDARVRWSWQWGDGAQTWTSEPGGRWPDDSLTHTYRGLGATTARVTAVWRGEYVVDGLGPFPVPGAPLTQDDAVAIDVREARALLVR